MHRRRLGLLKDLVDEDAKAKSAPHDKTSSKAWSTLYSVIPLSLGVWAPDTKTTWKNSKQTTKGKRMTAASLFYSPNSISRKKNNSYSKSSIYSNLLLYWFYFYIFHEYYYRGILFLTIILPEERRRHDEPQRRKNPRGEKRRHDISTRQLLPRTRQPEINFAGAFHRPRADAPALTFFGRKFPAGRCAKKAAKI